MEFSGEASPRVRHSSARPVPARRSIDGGHSEEAARKDYDGWAKWVSAGGALIIHDVFPDPRDGGRRPTRSIAAHWKAARSWRESVTGSMRVLERTAGDAGVAV